MQSASNSSFQAQRPLTGHHQTNYSSKNRNLLRIQGQEYAVQPQKQIMFMGNQARLTAEQAAALYTLQQSTEAAHKKKKMVPSVGGRNFANEEYKSNPASMNTMSNEYITSTTRAPNIIGQIEASGRQVHPLSYSASRNMNFQSQSLGGLSNNTGQLAAGLEPQTYPIIEPTATNTAELTASNQLLGSAEMHPFSVSGSLAQNQMNQALSGVQYQNQLLAAKNMERLKKGRAQSAVKRDLSKGGAKAAYATEEQQNDGRGQQTIGPLTNPNILQAYNYQEVMNTSHMSNHTTMLSHSNNQSAKQLLNPAAKQTGGKSKPQRPTSAAVRPGQPRTLQGRQKLRMHQGGMLNQFDEHQIIYGMNTTTNQQQQLQTDSMQHGATREVPDGQYEFPSQESVDGILTVLNQYRNLTGNPQASFTTEQAWMPIKDPNKYTQDFVQLGQSREQFQYPDYQLNLNKAKVSRNSVGHQVSSFPSGMAKIDGTTSQYASSKRLGFQNRRGPPSEAGSGVTRHTIASSEKRKFPLRPTTAQQRSRLAFAVHGLTQKESVEELAEKEMLGFETQFSQANLSLALTNAQGVQSHTRLSSGRASQVGRVRPKFTQQTKGVYIKNNINAVKVAKSYQQVAESTPNLRQGLNPKESFSPSQAPNRFSSSITRKQSVAAKVNQKQMSAPYMPLNTQNSLSNRQRPKTAAIGRSHRVQQLRNTAGTIGISASYLDHSQNTDNEPTFQANLQKVKSKTTQRLKDGLKKKGYWDQRPTTILSSRARKKSGGAVESQATKKTQQRVTIAENRPESPDKDKAKQEKPSGHQVRKSPGSKPNSKDKIRPQTAQRGKQEYNDLNLLASILNAETKIGGDDPKALSGSKNESKYTQLSFKKEMKKNEIVNINHPRSSVNQASGRASNSRNAKHSTIQDDQVSLVKSDMFVLQRSQENLADDVKINTVQSATMDDEEKSEHESLHHLNDLTGSTKDHNNIVMTYLSVLDQMEEYAVDKQGFSSSKLAKSVSGTDCLKKLLKASQDMKAIRFHCNNLIAKDEERLVDIKTTTRGDCTKGPDNHVDLIAGCPLFCRIPLKARKQPLKISLRQNDKLPSLAEFGDLKICLSDQHKNPTQTQCLRKYQNPGGSLYLQDPSEWPEVKEMLANQRGGNKEKLGVQDSYQNLFVSEELYISFQSERNCTLNIVCQFPKEVGMDDEKPEKKERTNIRSEKALRAKFTDFIQQQIRELTYDSLKRDKYFTQIQQMKQRLQRPTLKETETDFRSFNILLVRNLAMHLRNQQRARQEVDTKIEVAKLRRDQFEEERIEQLKFESIKWELYRMRCEQIFDDYADFKRHQKKIKWWLQIALRHIAVKVIHEQFKVNQAKVARQRLEKIMYGRICRGLKNYLERKGRDEFIRFSFWYRDSLSFAHLPIAITKRKQAIGLIHAFLKTESVFYNTKKKVSDFRNQVVFIQLSIKKMIIIRHIRTQILDDFFEKELSIMQKHYTEKSKKTKKLRSKVQALSSIPRSSKQMIITAYMKKISFRNMIDQMFYQANIYLKKDQRPDGKLEYKEYRNIQQLMRNQNRARSFLFDGIKELEPVGNHLEETLKLSNQSLRLLQHLKDLSEVKPGSSLPPSVLNGSAGPGTSSVPSGTQAITRKDSLDSAAGHDLLALDEMDPEAQAGNTIAGPIGSEPMQGEEKKSKSESKPKGKSPSGKKGSKKGGGHKKQKKAKPEEEVDLAWEIPTNKDSPGLNLFLPDRMTMQMMINRAVGLKDWERMPEFEEVRPWIKQKNQDVMI